MTRRRRSQRLSAPLPMQAIPPRRRAENVMFIAQLVSTLTCPVCGHQGTETMPSDAFQYFYECSGRKNALEAQSRRLLRVLFFRRHTVSTDSGSAGKGFSHSVLRIAPTEAA